MVTPLERAANGVTVPLTLTTEVVIFSSALRENLDRRGGSVVNSIV
jgi:hypothetical protein